MLYEPCPVVKTTPRFKASETLLGIETYVYGDGNLHEILRFKASETLLGIETGYCVLYRWLIR